MDFNLGAGAYHSTMNYVRAALEQGQKVALFHWRRYDLDVTMPLNKEVRKLAQTHQDQIRVIAPGEEIKAEVILVGYPTILQHKIDRFPKVDFRRFVVIVNQTADRLLTGEQPEYDPVDIRANLQDMFGSVGDWIPISGLVRRLMLADDRYPEPHPDTWAPLIDTGKWSQRKLEWRMPERSRPVIGRQARDHANKWPSTKEAILAAYCADRDCEVRILGGAKRAVDVIGHQPRNWQVYDYDSVEVREFLSDLDFFIHYPHEEYVEAFGRSIIEAMAVGCPVVLPPVFESTFGAAALYASPDDVWGAIQNLWKDEALYLGRAKAGREFVLANCGLDQLAKRLDRLLLADPASR